MWTGLGCALLCLALVQAAVIRPEGDAASPETTTSVVFVDREGEDVTTEESATLAGPALSRDEEASIRILKIKDVHYVELTLSRSHRNPIIPSSNAITPS